MKAKIEYLKTKGPFKGPYGSFRVHEIKANGDWYKAYEGDWNTNWKVGDEIEIEFQIKTYKGKDEKWIQKPEKPTSTSLGSNEIFEEILSELRSIRELLETRNGSDEPPPYTDADAPPDMDDPYGHY